MKSKIKFRVVFVDNEVGERRLLCYTDNSDNASFIYDLAGDPLSAGGYIEWEEVTSDIEFEDGLDELPTPAVV